jgi:hypothetical protein
MIWRICLRNETAKMLTKSAERLSCFFLFLLFLTLQQVSAKTTPQANSLLERAEKATVFGMIDTLDHHYQFNWVKQFKIQVLVRGWMHFARAERHKRSLNWVIKDCRKDGILFSGGGVVNQIGLSPSLLKYAEKKEAVGLTPWGKPEPSEGKNVYSGSLYSKAFLNYKLHILEKQIDMGVNLIHLDVIVQLWDLNDKFDTPTITAFRNFLERKYPNYTAEDWKQNFDISSSKPWGGIHHFNYRTYLQNRRYSDGSFFADHPYNPANPLAVEWGIPKTGLKNNWRIFITQVFPRNSFMHQTVLRVSRYYASSLKAYAKKEGKQVLITFNGANPYADFQVDSGLTAYTVKKMTEYGIGEMILKALNHYPNSIEGERLKHVLTPFLQNPLQQSYGLKEKFLSLIKQKPGLLNKLKGFLYQIKTRKKQVHLKNFPLQSIIPDVQWIIQKSRKMIHNQKAPVVFFVDYPPPWQTLKLWSGHSVRGFLTKLCAEIYSAGGRFAFMPDFLQSFPAAEKSLQQMAVFIRKHSSFYHGMKLITESPLIQGTNSNLFTTTLWKSRETIKGKWIWILHIVNLNSTPADSLWVRIPLQIHPIKNIRFYSPSRPFQGIPIVRQGNKRVIQLPEFQNYGVVRFQS